MTIQREQNPDVNSRTPAADPAENPGATDSSRDNTDIERGRDQPVIPVPPDAEPTAPIEEPPGTDGPPVGDVDDSPKRIA
jgi:hypothetical protein